jgi:sirohydrochlorin cobaltochelatase
VSTDLTLAAPPALLVVGHGTKDVAGAEEFRQFVDRVGKRLAEQGVAAGGGFIELSPPPLADAVADLVAAGHRSFAAIPLMLVAAGHAKGDIPAALAREKERHPGITVSYGRPLGPHPVLLDVLTQRLDAVLDRADRSRTMVVLVGRGSTDPDANAEVAKVARLMFEGRGLGGVEPAFISLAEPGVPAALERCRRLGAQNLVVLPYFLFGGVLPDRIVAQSEEWAAGHPDVPVTVASLIGDCDELAGIVVERYAEALGADIRMNCDTCIYRVALPGFADRVGAPQTPHHHPDDPAHAHGHHDHPHHDG